jgi:hypothetical protein
MGNELKTYTTKEYKIIGETLQNIKRDCALVRKLLLVIGGIKHADSIMEFSCDIENMMRELDSRMDAEFPDQITETYSYFN